MKKEQKLRTYRPNGEVLYDLMEIAEKHKLDVYEFKAELQICLKALEKSLESGIFDGMEDIIKSMKTALNWRKGE